jgi:ribose/xylose/arabinose/galactoside ABC-type transport system permease subunit
MSQAQISLSPGISSLMAPLKREPLLWLIAAILLLGAFTSEYYLTGQNIENLLRSVSVFGLLALGMTVVMLTGRIDLSVAATMIFSIVVAVKLMVFMGDVMGLRWLVKGNTYAGPALPFLLIAIVTGGFVGAINGIGIAYFRVAPFIMTLVSLTALRGFNYVLTDGHPYYLRSAVFSFIGDQVVLGVPLSTLVFLAILIAMILFVNGTVAGGRFYAIGGSEKAALYAGIRTERYVVLAYVRIMRRSRRHIVHRPAQIRRCASGVRL